jgi:hypothetical protein
VITRNIEDAFLRAGFAGYSQRIQTQPPTKPASVSGIITRKAASNAGSTKNAWQDCTIFCHRAVNGVHSIENACSYKGVFLID